MSSKILKIAHFYPDLLNLYGDFGNVLALKKRAEWRGLEVEIVNIHLKSKETSNDIKKYTELNSCDIAFIGGGQDKQQMDVAEDFLAKKAEILEAIESGMPFLAVCGGYQLLGKYYETSEGGQIPGLDILNVITKAQKRDSGKKQKRLIGNVVAELNFPLELIHSLNLNSAKSRSETQDCFNFKTVVGFENHSGQTFIEENSKTKPFAKVKIGFGNNGEDSFEGAYYKNLIGTYLHGSLLPKNPHLVDELLYQALKRRNIFLDAKEWLILNDTLESEAHKKALSLR
jgi:lipid II isoglutaminyl synthase (glutamine-hydrolysing)